MGAYAGKGQLMSGDDITGAFAQLMAQGLQGAGIDAYLLMTLGTDDMMTVSGFFDLIKSHSVLTDDFIRQAFFSENA